MHDGTMRGVVMKKQGRGVCVCVHLQEEGGGEEKELAKAA
jgi:hypothetical protein